MIAPFAVALVLAATFRLTGGARRGALMMGLAIPLGILTALILTGSAQPFPPVNGMGKVFYIVLAGAFLGAFIDLTPFARPAQEPLVLIFPTASLVWIAWPKLTSGPQIAEIAILVLAWLASIVWLVRQDITAQETGSLVSGLLLSLAGGAVAGIALLAEAVDLGLLTAAVAVSALGFTLWRLAALILLGTPGHFGAAPLLGGGGALLALIYEMLIEEPWISRIALLVLVLLPFMVLPLRRLLTLESTGSRLLGTILVALLGGGVAAASVGIAFLSVTSH